MPKKIYTLWKAKKGEEDESLFLESGKLYKTKLFAFKRARQLAKQLPPGWDLEILVRRITIGSNLCEEFVFNNEKDKESK